MFHSGALLKYLIGVKTGKTIAIHPYGAGQLLEATSGRNLGADQADLIFSDCCCMERFLLILKK
jgi:hypothetical protein